MESHSRHRVPSEGLRPFDTQMRRWGIAVALLLSMAHENNSTAVFCACAVTAITLAGEPVRADDAPATREELRQLKQENQAPAGTTASAAIAH